ncbi:MAG: hypothetical protein A2Z29_09640 [Chloroflexi bacterium RBG_16_56_11]|nr:MAG: hypothetical protein A2Z29_09640 [Chloroflexi bacterium RBG_16_56_11]
MRGAALPLATHSRSQKCAYQDIKYEMHHGAVKNRNVLRVSQMQTEPQRCKEALPRDIFHEPVRCPATHLYLALKKVILERER